MMIKALIFDLDGTLLDTLDDLSDSMNLALQQMNFPTHDRLRHKSFIGNGIEIFASRALPEKARDEKTILRCVEFFNVEYHRRYNKKTLPYGGLNEVLKNLMALDLPLAVLSNKTDSFTKLMVKEFFPEINFSFICGSLPHVPKKPHPQAALELASQLNLAPANILFIGDSTVDIQTAKNAGMIPLGVTWGFRSFEELKKEGAQFIINAPSELIPIMTITNK